MATTDWNPVLRAELEKPYFAELRTFVTQQQLGRLVTVSADGQPHIGLYPFVFLDDRIEMHLHRNDEQLADLVGNPRCVFEVDEVLGSIPSHWGHPTNAMFATSYHRTVIFECEAAAVGARIRQFIAIERHIVFERRSERPGGVEASELRVRAPAVVVARVADALFPQHDKIPACDLAFDRRRHGARSTSIMSCARRTIAASLRCVMMRSASSIENHCTRSYSRS